MEQINYNIKNTNFTTFIVSIFILYLTICYFIKYL